MPNEDSSAQTQITQGSSNVVRNINTVDIDINGNNEPETSNSNDDECGIIANHSPSDDEEEYSKVDQSRNPFGITFENLKIGETYDVLDSTDRWCEAQVVKKNNNEKRVYISYTYWDKRFDEWIASIPQRFAPLHAHTYTVGGTLKISQRVEALDERNMWLEAFICEETPNRVKIHYKGFHNKFDQWIDRDSPRIRPFGPAKNVQQKRKDPKQFKVPGKINQQHDAHMASLLKNNNLPNRMISEYKHSSDNKENLYGTRMNDVYVDPEADPAENSPLEERTRKISELSDHFFRYKTALERHNLRVVSVSGDGNCLFRSVAHQIYGDDNLHWLVREKCVDYMESEADFFSQFVEGGRESFPFYLQAKRCDACWGDDPEIEAICELYNRPAEIWAFDPLVGAQKLRTFHESTASNNHSLSRGMNTVPTMRLSYYGGGHYDSIVNPWHSEQLVRRKPGELEDYTIARSLQLVLQQKSNQ